VKKKYREVSRLIHPDKCRKEIREVAEKAFTKLGAAKTELLDEKKREELNKIVYDARQRVILRLQKEIKRKRKQEAKLARDRGDPPKEKEPLPDVSRSSNFDDLVKAETREVLIEQEWKKRQMSKASTDEEKKLADEKKELEKKKERRRRRQKEMG